MVRRISTWELTTPAPTIRVGVDTRPAARPRLWAQFSSSRVPIRKSVPYSQPRASSGAGWLSGSMKAARAIRTIVASEVAAMILPTASMIFGWVRLA